MSTETGDRESPFTVTFQTAQDTDLVLKCDVVK